jgi:hypothetical protein
MKPYEGSVPADVPSTSGPLNCHHCGRDGALEITAIDAIPGPAGSMVSVTYQCGHCGQPVHVRQTSPMSPES